MEKLFENPILDDLYGVRGEELENEYKNKYGVPNEIERADKMEDEFINTIKKNVTDDKKLEEILSMLNKFEMAIIGKYCFWYGEYYKLGFVDSICFRNEVLKEKSTINKTKNSIFNNSIKTIVNFIREENYTKLKERKDYNEIIEKIEQIKNKYPKVRLFIEDEKIEEFTKEDVKALLEIKEFIEFMEIEETLKIGIREGSSL